MSDRAAYILGAAILAGAALLAFAPRPDPPAAAPSGVGSPVVHSMQVGKAGETAVIAAFPDGRYILWRQFGTGLTKDSEGVAAGR